MTKGDLLAAFETDLHTALLAHTSLLHIETSEWERLEASISRAIESEANESGEEERVFIRYTEVRNLSVWNTRLQRWDPEDERIKRIRVLQTLSEKIIALRDEFPHPFVLLLDDQHAHVVLRKQRLGSAERHFGSGLLRDFVRLKRDVVPQANRKTMIISGEFQSEVPEIAHEMVRLVMPLPDEKILGLTLDKVLTEMNKFEQVSARDEIIRAALGLTVMEAEIAYSHALAMNGELNLDSVPLIMGKKRDIIRRSGALDYIEPKVNMDSVGGLDRLKAWLEKRRTAYSTEAKDRGLPTPKGVLLTGVPGCGKSLTAKAIASEWSLPLVRFDIGSVFQGVVGESEASIRNALKIAEAASPCVLWIDEIEKGLAGSGGSGNLDSGVGLRVFGTILSWMNDNESDVFVVATANNLSNLPPELKRKGRFDEIFFVDLPNRKSREDIFKIHLDEAEPNWDQRIDLKRLSELTEDWTGAEIEAAVQDSLFSAFSNGNRPIEENDLRDSIQATTPQAQSMADDIEEMRKAADAIGQRASSMAIIDESGGGQVY